MEKRVIKWTLYGFLISLAIAILFVDYKVKTSFSGGYRVDYVNVYDYVVSILRYSIIGGFLGMLVGVLVIWTLSDKNSEDKL